MLGLYWHVMKGNIEGYLASGACIQVEATCTCFFCQGEKTLAEPFHVQVAGIHVPYNHHL